MKRLIAEETRKSSYLRGNADAQVETDRHSQTR